MKRLYIITSTINNEILAVSHGKSIDCRNMSEKMYHSHTCVVKDVDNAEADRLLKLPWKFQKAVD